MKNRNSLAICYRCNTMQEPVNFRCTADDPLAQVCDKCKLLIAQQKLIDAANKIPHTVITYY